MNEQHNGKNKFIQVHWLTSYPGSLLNRDDAGLAKRLPFGGVTRIRISSQCLKRHWRMYEGEHSIRSISEPSVRSRTIFSRKILKPLVDEGLDEEKVKEILLEIGKAIDVKPDENSLETNQVIVMGPAEIELIKNVVRECLEASGKVDVKKLLKQKMTELKTAKSSLAAGLDGALFGRMVTGDVLSRVDAAIHVAHAFTVHAQESESDYFTVVDDLRQESEELGAGHINETELTSGIFYGYVVINRDQLVENLNDDAQLAAKVIENIIHVIATVSPGAKQGSTAPYACAEFMLVEKGDTQPRTLANAFRKPVAPEFQPAIESLSSYLKKMDKMYGSAEQRRYVSLHGEIDGVSDAVSLDELARWAAGDSE